MKRILYTTFASLLATIGLAQTNYVSTAPSSSTPGADNTLVGVGAGNLNMSGASNLFIGRGTGAQNMAGTQNVFVGASAGAANTSGQGNSFVGYSAGGSNVGGINNTFLGAGAGFTNDAGFGNLFLGQQAGYSNTGGNNNAFLGKGAGYSNQTGINNAFIGADAGSVNTTGGDNVFAGSLAGSGNTTGAQNVFIGSKAGSGNTTAAQNTFVGFESGLTSTGAGNTFMGYQAGRNNQSGSYNVFLGFLAGTSNTTGLGNLFMGQQAGANNTGGNYNLFIGNSTGSANVSGLGNTAVGDGSLLRNSAGIHNAAIGRYAGVESRGDENVFIGFAADVTPSTPNLTNATAIGARARVSQSNSIVLGASANVGIGTSAPNNKLEVVSAAAGTSGLRLTNLTTSNTGTIATATRFLTVNAAGDVVLGSTSGGRLGIDGSEGNWTVAGDNLINTNAGGVVIGPGVSKTPAGYRLFVSEGILTEKVKVAVANTADWSDKVFAKTYALQSLAQVEQHINAHGHLPGVPSAEEVVRDGVDVGKMDAKLLEKIEELTLYMIQLKKETQALRLENKRIKQQIRRGSTDGTRK